MNRDLGDEIDHGLARGTRRGELDLHFKANDLGKTTLLRRTTGASPWLFFIKIWL
jgi:hypothetical protein